jgi:hypothetical protein
MDCAFSVFSVIKGLALRSAFIGNVDVGSNYGTGAGGERANVQAALEQALVFRPPTGRERVTILCGN